GDVNGDGRLDIVSAVQNASKVTALLNTTTPGSATASFLLQAISAGRFPQSVALADLNGDGSPDIVVGDVGTGHVPILLNTPTLLAGNGTGTLLSAPVVQSLNAADPTPTNAATVHFTVTFSKPVSAPTAGNFALTGNGTAGASVGTPTT